MEPGKSPDENQPLSFLIPLGPEEDAPADSPKANYNTPAPVRIAPQNDAPKAPKAAEPLVFLDSFGSPKTQPPPVPNPLADTAGLVAPPAPPRPQPLVAPQAAPPAPAPLADFFLGKPTVEEKPFQAPIGPISGPPPAPFEMPEDDKGPEMPWQARQVSSASTEAFQLPKDSPAMGAFKMNLAPPPANAPPLPAPHLGGSAGAPPAVKGPVPAMPAGGRDASAIARPPHTAPPMRLSGIEPPAPKPLSGLAAPLAAAAAPASAEPTGPLSFLELFECSAKLVLTPQAVAERCRAAPVPSARMLISYALVWAGVSFAIRTGLTVGTPNSGISVTPFGMYVALPLAFIFAAVAFLFSGALTHGLGRLSGGTGEFRRGLQVAALLAPLSALGAVIALADALWWLPGLLGAFLFARTLSGLYSAPILQVGVIVGALAIVGGAAQFKARRMMAQLRETAVVPVEAAAAAAQAVRLANELTQQQAVVLEQLQSQAGSNLQVPTGEGSALDLVSQEDGQEGMAGPKAGNAFSAAGGPMGATADPSATQTAQSILRMMPTLGAGANMTPEQKRALQAKSGAMIQEAQKALNDPRTTEGMSAKEKEQYRQLQEATKSLFRATEGGPAPSQAETQKIMKQLGQFMQTVQDGMQQPPPQPKPARKRRRAKPRPTEDE